MSGENGQQMTNSIEASAQVGANGMNSSGSSFWKSFIQRADRFSAENLLFLTPAVDDPSRTGTLSSAIFNLIATMVGGGVLSLPYALDKAGVVLGLVYLIVAALLSAYSIRLLLSCSRRSGATSYEEVALKSFGVRAQYFTMALVIALTYLAIIAYLILARDLASPLIESYVAQTALTTQQKNFVAFGIVVLISPFCFAS